MTTAATPIAAKVKYVAAAVRAGWQPDGERSWDAAQVLHSVLSQGRAGTSRAPLPRGGQSLPTRLQACRQEHSPRGSHPQAAGCLTGWPKGFLDAGQQQGDQEVGAEIRERRERNGLAPAAPTAKWRGRPACEDKPTTVAGMPQQARFTPVHLQESKPSRRGYGSQL